MSLAEDSALDFHRFAMRVIRDAEIAEKQRYAKAQGESNGTQKSPRSKVTQRREAILKGRKDRRSPEIRESAKQV